MPSYRLQRRLSHADVDFLGELKVAALLGLLEQAAVEASTAVGFDAARYTREGRIWIIRRTRLQRFIPVGGTDTVEVETHVDDFRRARSLRRYTVRRDGVAVAEATTDWVYCDLQSGRPARIPETLQRAFMDGNAHAPLPREGSLPAAGSGEPLAFELTTQPSHLDHVAHVNNAVYASYLEDAAFALFAARGWPLTRMLAVGGALRIRSLDFEYLSDALAGEHLMIHSWPLEESPTTVSDAEMPSPITLLQTITRTDGSEVMRAQSSWAWRRKPSVIGGVPEV
jgi:acyl-CoA thioester hydrolase